MTDADVLRRIAAELRESSQNLATTFYSEAARVRDLASELELLLSLMPDEDSEPLLSVICRRGACHLDSCTGYVPLAGPEAECECDCHHEADEVGAEVD